jgi:endonuclease III
MRLLSKFPDPKSMSRATAAQIRARIRETGLSTAKAEGIRAAARLIVERYDGKVPSTERDLLTLPMVGPKTAHAVLVFGYRHRALPVDVHILRVARRIGVIHGDSIPAAQHELARRVPKRYWHLLNPVLVQHGQNLCSARHPECQECPIARWCARIGVSDCSD